MPCLSTSRRNELNARLIKRRASLVLAEATYDELIASGITSYRFDSTEGEQQTVRQKPGDVKKQIDMLEAEIDSIARKLTGGGIVNMGLRRW